MDTFSGEQTPGGGMELDLNSLLDVSVEISVEIGRTKMTIGELVSLSKGAIIELNKAAGSRSRSM
jgi:flagellar motor switch protein FliN/FliY